MTEMIEKVAKALMDADPDSLGNSICLLETKHHGDCTKAPYTCAVCTADNARKLATAALTAMKEPTDRMVGGGEALSDFHLPDVMGNTTEERRKEMKVAYQYMIELALGEPDGD